MKSKDVRLLIFISVVVLSLLCVHIISGDKAGAVVRITEGGNIVGEYPLSEDRTISLSHNTVMIKDSSVCVSDADCPDKLCVKQGLITDAGEVIACLPNRVTVEILASEKTSNDTPITYSGIHFDTVVSVTVYGYDDPAGINALIREECERYELLCSRTNADSELYKLNHRLITDTIELDHDGAVLSAYKVSPELYEMISEGLEAYDFSSGNFDIAIAPLSDLWDFRSGEHVIPSEDKIESVLPHLSPDSIILTDDEHIAFLDDECMIDLGGLAKGYIGDRLKIFLEDKGVSSAIIALGGNVVALGDKNGEPYEVGIRRPFGQGSELSATVSVRDRSVVTSGTYERYFESGGTLYHHILNPLTGYPYDTDLSSATVICDSSTDGDILSTVLLTEGADKAAEHADKLKDEEIYVILIDNAGNVILNTYDN